MKNRPKLAAIALVAIICFAVLAVRLPDISRQPTRTGQALRWVHNLRFLFDRTDPAPVDSAPIPYNGWGRHINHDERARRDPDDPLNIQPPSRLPRPIAASITNVALDRPVTASAEPNLILGEPEMVTDGDKTIDDGHLFYNGYGPQWIQIDLEQAAEIWTIAMWLNPLYHATARDVVVQVSNDPTFNTRLNVFNNDHDNTLGFGRGDDYEYIERPKGKIIVVDGVVGRYVRVWSNGGWTVGENLILEVEVHGRPPR